MNWDVVCPACGGPGRVERDVFGAESVVCDAYQRCHPNVVETATAMVEDFYGDPRDPELHWDMQLYEWQLAEWRSEHATFPLLDGVA